VDIQEDDTGWTLYQKVREESYELFKETLPDLLNEDLEAMRTPQTEFEGPRYFYPKSSLNDIKKIPLDRVTDGSAEVYDRIRALDFPPHEPAYTIIQNEKVYLTLTGYQEI
jgi:methionyl-tRNA formyltransferase